MWAFSAKSGTTATARQALKTTWRRATGAEVGLQRLESGLGNALLVVNSASALY